MPSFRGSSQPRDQTRVSCLLHWQADSLPPAPPGKPNIVGQSVSLVAQSCLTLCDPMNCSMPGFPVHHQLLEFTQTHVPRVIDAIQPSHPLHLLLLLPSIFPSIRVFSNESVLGIRWPKYWTFSFSISPSNEYSGLISFRIKDLLEVQGTSGVSLISLKSKGLSGVFSNTTVQKHQFFGAQLSL